MNIDDLIQPHLSNITTGTSLRSRVKKRYQQAKAALGVGANAYAMSISDPFLIKKKSRLTNHDNFDNFSEYVIKNQNHNPFLPRIYKIKRTNFNREDFVGSDYVIEKLFPLHDFDQKMKDSLITQLFDMETFLKDIGDMYENKSFDLLKDMLYNPNIMAKSIFPTCEIIVREHGLLYAFFSIILNYFKLNKIEKYFKNKLFYKTLDEIYNLFGFFDLHSENVMVRLAGGIPQLVLTDPV